mmetsp:Transcript_7545/g.17106  ORF Transcript_7545/g.17106 Transcript_7545/m.17106 type:complete len:248 (-) Transcript_7545:365-1108(-)
MMIDSISNKSKLGAFSFCNGYGYRSLPIPDDPMALAAPNVQHLVCNLSSFEALCHSNHHLNWIGFNTDTFFEQNETLLKAFDINSRSYYGASITRRLRCKLRCFFFQGEFDVQPFAVMDVNLMPNVLELVTKTEICVREDEDMLGSGEYHEVGSDLDGVYRLLRNCHLPELFSFPSLETKARELEAKYAMLEAELESKTREFAAKIAALEADKASLMQKNQQLIAEIETIQSGSSSSPNKRTKTMDD